MGWDDPLYGLPFCSSTTGYLMIKEHSSNIAHIIHHHRFMAGRASLCTVTVSNLRLPRLVISPHDEIFVHPLVQNRGTKEASRYHDSRPTSVST